MPHFATFDGQSIFYDDQGDGDPVMLLHGFVGDINIDWIRSGILDLLLDEEYRVVAFDARGHGLSAKPHELSAYENDALTKDAQALLDHLGIDRCTVVGFSMGARTALHLSVVDPRVQAVVAMGLGEHSLQHRQGATGAVPDALLTDDPESIEQETLRHYREMADAIHADRQALASLMAAARTEVPQIVDDIKVPVLVVTGADDVTAGDPAPLAAALADGTSVLTSGDHAGVKDQPDAHRAIVEFLGSR